MFRFILTSFLLLSLQAASAQSYQYLRIVIDSSANFMLRELEWFDGGISYPTAAMTAFNAPSPLEVTGGNANWERFRIYDDDSLTHAAVGYISNDQAIFREFILNLGVGNGITPDSLRITKPPWSGLTRFRAYLSDDNINWELYLDSTLAPAFYSRRSFPLQLVVDNSPPTAPSTLTSPYQTATQVYLEWGASTDDFRVEQYHIFQKVEPLLRTLFFYMYDFLC